MLLIFRLLQNKKDKKMYVAYYQLYTLYSFASN